jgi:hypothetical protein
MSEKFMSEECPQLKKLPENVREFWEDKQRELDDTLLRFSYAILVIPGEYFLVEKVGLIYLMKKNLWFEDFQKPPFFLFARSAPQYKKTIIQIPLETVENFETVRQSTLQELFLGEKRRSGFFKNIFQLLSSDPLYLLISGKQAADSDFQYAFRELDNPVSWVQTLSDWKART